MAGARAGRSCWDGASRSLRELHDDGRARTSTSSAWWTATSGHPLDYVGPFRLPDTSKRWPHGDVRPLVRRPRGSAPPPGVTVRRAGPEHSDGIARLPGAQRRAPPPGERLDREDLVTAGRLPGLSMSDFHVALRGDGLMGCLARWDQRASSKWLCAAMARRSTDGDAAADGALRVCRLRPPAGRLAPDWSRRIASHLAVDDDDTGVFAQPCWRAVHNDAAALGNGLLVLGLPEDHPLDAVVHPSAISTTRANSTGGVDRDRVARDLDDRPVWPEVAVL